MTDALLISDCCRVVGSCVGGRAQMREMFHLASLHNIKPIVDKMPLEQCNEAVDKLMSGNARYRYDCCFLQRAIMLAVQCIYVKLMG